MKQVEILDGVTPDAIARAVNEQAVQDALNVNQAALDNAVSALSNGTQTLQQAANQLSSDLGIGVNTAQNALNSALNNNLGLSQVTETLTIAQQFGDGVANNIISPCRPRTTRLGR